MPVKVTGNADPSFVSFAKTLFKYAEMEFWNLYGIQVSKLILREIDRKEKPIWAAIELDSKRHWIVEADSCEEIADALDELCEKYDEGLWQDATMTK